MEQLDGEPVLDAKENSKRSWQGSDYRPKLHPTAKLLSTSSLHQTKRPIKVWLRVLLRDVDVAVFRKPSRLAAWKA